MLTKEQHHGGKMIVVDAHEDIAWNALTFGRDYTLSVADNRVREAGTETPLRNGHTMLGWPEWVNGRVAVIFATLFASPVRKKYGPWDTLCYADANEAHQLYHASLEFYLRLVEDNPDKFYLIQTQADLDEVLESWDREESTAARIGLVILMEGADCVREPGELPDWYQVGVRILGPAWSGTRYAGGTGEPGPLTNDGRVLLQNMSDLGMILDLSHMTEEGAMEAIDQYGGPIIASHSNPLALLPHSARPERHLNDIVISRIAERGGVIGLVLGNEFIKSDWRPSDGREVVTLYDVIAHVDHVCQVIGSAANVGLGTDFDGGFGLDRVPIDLDSVADLRLIGDALITWGYGLDDVEAILGGNWLRILRQGLPED
jgi:membrane dipeptidase